MVSKASEDLPEPLRPVMTIRLSRGSLTSMPLRLCSRAPRTTISRLRLGLSVVFDPIACRAVEEGRRAKAWRYAARCGRAGPPPVWRANFDHLSVSAAACQNTIDACEHR